MSKILLALFDLGGVVVKWSDRWLYREVSKKTGIEESLLASVCQQELYQLHLGRVTEEQFWKTVLDKVSSDSNGVNYDHESILENALSLTPSPIENVFSKHATIDYSIVDLIKSIKKHHNIQVGVVSNITPPTHRVIDTKKLLDDFDFLFLSHELGMIKPNQDIYEHVLRNVPFDADRILFVDDKQSNVDAAKKANINAVRFVSFWQLGQDFASFGISADPKQNRVIQKQ